jgi:hypothetical protein
MIGSRTFSQNWSIVSCLCWSDKDTRPSSSAMIVTPAVEPASTQLAPTLAEYLRLREGGIWDDVDTLWILAHAQKVDQFACELIRRGAARVHYSTATVRTVMEEKR